MIEEKRLADEPWTDRLLVVSVWVAVSAGSVWFFILIGRMFL